MMKNKLMTIGVIAALCASASACTQTEQRTVGYGASGAALGALAGGALSGSGRGALAGAALGGAAGAVVGTAATQKHVVYAEDDGVERVHVRRMHHHPVGSVATVKVTQTRTPASYCDHKDAYGEVYRAPC
ncbi:hypothetical protein [Bartonella sp. TP]|uniref:hypothetical protein n=1 Tax=Bartonella sp. TP TaxID=3057550 RepID=UPI0025B24474|nr:hypothetical protein [Bartonella sp. TP]WJW79580.1 hypothetical protein QVL57_03405 [Bartonella sp. TP]